MNLRTGWSKEIWKGVCNNMASIRERNGKFNVIYSYTNEKGERKQKWETYETKAEAKRRKKEIEYKKEMGSFVVRKCKTLDELITEYVALYGKENWALIGCTQITPVCEIEQGVVVSNLKNHGFVQQIISKSGGFGTKDVLVKIADKILNQK